MAIFVVSVVVVVVANVVIDVGSNGTGVRFSHLDGGIQQKACIRGGHLKAGEDPFLAPATGDKSPQRTW